MPFVKKPLTETFQVKHIYSLHYFEFAKDFIFEGEQHDFWEFLYVDKGEIEVMADAVGYKLEQGDILFHKPNEFHRLWANQKIAPNLIVVCFDCRSPSMSYFADKIFSLDDYERNIIATLIKMGYATYVPPLDNPRIHTLKKRKEAPFASEQLIKIHMELLLIDLATKGNLKGTMLREGKRLSSTTKEKSEDDITKRSIQFMQNNIHKNLSFEEIYYHLNISKTHLTTLFKSKIGLGVMKFFKNLKIEQAKLMIREEKLNITEIAELLNYSSIHVFSKRFKHVTSMTPSEYAKSVKART
jgi:AraC-like DNA-binding protein